MDSKEDAADVRVGGASDTGEPPGNSLGSMFGALALGFMTAGLGTLFCFVLYYGYLRADESRQWAETPCVIEKSSVDKGRATQDSAISYRFRIEYRYTFDGQDYTGTRVTRADGPTSMQSKAEALLVRYPAGAEIVCYVNPEAPSEAILQHNSSAIIYTVWFPGLFVIGGFGIALSGVRGWLRRRKFQMSGSCSDVPRLS